MFSLLNHQPWVRISTLSCLLVGLKVNSSETQGMQWEPDPWGWSIVVTRDIEEINSIQLLTDIVIYLMAKRPLREWVFWRVDGAQIFYSFLFHLCFICARVKRKTFVEPPQRLNFRNLNSFCRNFGFSSRIVRKALVTFFGN